MIRHPTGNSVLALYMSHSSPLVVNNQSYKDTPYPPYLYPYNSGIQVVIRKDSIPADTELRSGPILPRGSPPVLGPYKLSHPKPLQNYNPLIY